MRENLEEALKLPIAEAAERMGISRQMLHLVIAGKNRVSADMALRFARLAGTEPALYLHMQDELDLWEAERRLAKELRSIPPAAAER
jgi:addiction module HigA family antidote